MKQVFRFQVFRFIVICALGAGIFSACDDKKIDSNIISQGSQMSAEAQENAKHLDKESYKDLADLFLDTSEIDFSREVLIIFGKNQCKYCDMLKDDIKKSPAIQAKIKEHFNPYYVNTSYDKVHRIVRNAKISPSLAEGDKGGGLKAQKNSGVKFSNNDSTHPLTPSAREGEYSKESANLINTQNLSQIFGVNATPQVVFLDKKGRVKYLFAGYTLNFEKMIDDVVANVKSSGAPLGDYESINKALNALQNHKGQSK